MNILANIGPPPSWLTEVPIELLFFSGDPRGCPRLLQWLANGGYPAPTLWELTAARLDRRGKCA